VAPSAGRGIVTCGVAHAQRVAALLRTLCAGMAIGSVYVEPADLLVVVWDGKVTLAEWQAAIARQLADERSWWQGRRRLADLTTAAPSEIQSADLEHIVETTAPQVPGFASRLAIITRVDWTLASEFAERVTGAGAATMVFDRLETACSWLGVEPDAVRPSLEALRAVLRTRHIAD
jgi:hypothetical protein